MKDALNTERFVCRSNYHSMPFGPSLLPEGGVLFRLWAPGAENIELCLINNGEQPVFSDMEALPDGWFQLKNQEAAVGSLYQFRINGDLLVPDPASRFQPQDIRSKPDHYTGPI